jgi:large subunit ribosomal protein L3
MSKRAKDYPAGLIGKKLGMTQIFAASGEAIPVTVVELGPCVVLDVKDQSKHGYSAVQFGFGPKKPSRVNKAELGHFNRAGKGQFYHVTEMRCDVEGLGWKTLGQEVRVEQLFSDGELVDVSGVTIGRGFSGVFRRYLAGGQPATRGTHEYRRHIGAIGCRKFPGRVFKNQRMPGRHGGKNVTIQNLQVAGVKADQNLLLVRGGIPGPTGALVMVTKAIKSGGKAAAA